MWGSQEHSIPRASQMKFIPTVLVWEEIPARDLAELHFVPRKTFVDYSYYVAKYSVDLTATKLF